MTIEAGEPHGAPEVRIADLAGGVGVVLLLGEHDLSTASEVRNTLAFLLERGADVIVDLSETGFMDSSIIHALEDSLHLASHLGMRVTFQLGTQTVVKRVLELTGALQVWPVYGTRAEAVNAVSAGLVRGGTQ